MANINKMRAHLTILLKRKWHNKLNYLLASIADIIAEAIIKLILYTGQCQFVLDKRIFTIYIGDKSFDLDGELASLGWLESLYKLYHPGCQHQPNSRIRRHIYHDLHFDSTFCHALAQAITRNVNHSLVDTRKEMIVDVFDSPQSHEGLFSLTFAPTFSIMENEPLS